MAIVNRSFSVNVTPGMMPPIVHVSEYDVGRAYTVSILDEQGNTFTIPSGTTASIEGTLNGAVGFTQSATVSNNQVSFTLSQSMTAYSGKAWCKIKLTQNSQPIQTCAFILAVDRAGVEADTILGGSGFQEQINEGIAEYFDNDPPFFELPSGGQSGQALLSDGAGGAYWGQAQGGGSLPAGYAYADSIPENANHNIKYILPDGYIWEWSDSETTVAVPYNAATGGLLNKVPVQNQNVETAGDKAGAFLSAPIPWDSSWTQYEKAPTIVRITGNKTLVPIWYNTSLQMFYYDSNGNFKFSIGQNSIHSFVGGSPALGASIPLPCEFNLADNNFYPLDGTGYVRIYLGISSDGSITANDVNDIVINVPFYDTEETVSGGSWVNTGVKYTPGDSGDVTDLELRVDDLETDVEALSSSVTNLQSKVNIKDEGKILIAVGDSITRGASAGGENYAWPKHVIDINGYDAVNSLNLGQNGLGFDTAATGSGDTIKTIVDRTDFSVADIVTVALGCNDWSNSNARLDNVWANMEYCFNKIRTDNPYCKLFYILPFNQSFRGSFSNFYCLSFKGDSNTACPYAYTLMQYINMIKDKLEESTFKAFRIQTIDMVECAAINRHNILTALADQVHPTAATQRLLGEEIARRIMLADGAR